MNKRLTILGLALTVALALGALGAGGVQAQFTSTASHTIYQGPQGASHQFTAGSGVGSISCTTALLLGTGSGTSQTTLTLEPVYSGCKDSLGRSVDVMNNTVALHYLSGGSKGTVTFTGEVQFTVTGSPHCTITITGDQTHNGVSYKNNEDGTVTLAAETNNIHSVISGGFFACGTSATTSTNGTYTGTTVLKGEDGGGGGSVAISVD